MPTSVIVDDGCDLRQIMPTTNFDGGWNAPYGPPGTEHCCGMETKANECSPIMHFDFSSEIPSGDSISLALLYLYITFSFNIGGAPHPSETTWPAFKVKRDAYNSDDWVTSIATHTIYKAATNWQIAGCAGANDRYNASPSPVYFYGPTGTGLPKWFSVDITTLVQAAHAEDQIMNILVHGYKTLGARDDLRWGWNSYGADSNKPYLSITHASAVNAAPGWGQLF